MYSAIEVNKQIKNIIIFLIKNVNNIRSLVTIRVLMLKKVFIERVYNTIY